MAENPRTSRPIEVTPENLTFEDVEMNRNYL
jgi:hypothetical protein